MERQSKLGPAACVALMLTLPYEADESDSTRTVSLIYYSSFRNRRIAKLRDSVNDLDCGEAFEEEFVDDIFTVNPENKLFDKPQESLIDVVAEVVIKKILSESNQWTHFLNPSSRLISKWLSQKLKSLLPKAIIQAFNAW